MQRKPIISLPQLIIIVAATILATTITVLAASDTTNATNAPALTSSYTLEDIYQRLTNGTAGTQSTFTEPSVAPGTGNMHDLNDIMSAAPEIDNTNGATANQVLQGQTFWGLTNGEWGFRTGNITTRNSLTGANGQLSFNIPNGYYNNKTSTAADANLNAENIRHGITIFGITGKYQTGWSYYSTRGTTLEDIDLLTGTDGWAVGGMHAYHWNGTDWNSSYNVLSSLHTVDMVDSNDVWAAASGETFYHWNGSTWTRVSADTGNAEIHDIGMLNSKNGWAVGGYGRFYHYDGSNWQLHTTTAEGRLLTGIAMLTNIDGWAVDSFGHAYRWDGSTWSLYPSFTVYRLYAIDMVNSSNGWAVGEGGLIYHWNGTTWSEFTNFGHGNDIVSVNMISSTEGWAAGANGAIYYYDGTSWVLYTNTGTAIINKIEILNHNGWAVNDNGEIYALRD